ncbi:hypothetical protein TNIN_501041 [Trichonephila inaurata madagascariensis]|uniref:Uncharacterized protein n=1 Tax=Trichonephila inaurata madagascariensis TaxID=2747483 RepID=A0A8X7BSD8_9ARAC|nr:hypothetical protein TNIN_501041 [Trichonephila inaurata madagascariensis]
MDFRINLVILSSAKRKGSEHCLYHAPWIADGEALLLKKEIYLLPLSLQFLKISFGSDGEWCKESQRVEGQSCRMLISNGGQQICYQAVHVESIKFYYSSDEESNMFEADAK